MAYYNGSLDNVSLNDLKHLGDNIDHQGNEDVSTIMIYTHVLKHGPLGVKSPAGFLK